MADIRIKDLTTTASSTASDDFIAVDGTTNGTRKLNAFSPTFGGNATVTGTLTVNGTGSSSVATTTSFTVNNATPIPVAGFAVGPVGTGGSFLVNTPSVSSSYGSGLAIDGSYPGGIGAQSVVNVKAFGVMSGGGYGSTLSFQTTLNGTFNEVMKLTSGSVVQVLGTTASTSTSSGALVVGNGTSGGLGVGGAAWLGTYLAFTGAHVGTSSGVNIGIANASSKDLLFAGDATRGVMLQGYHDGSNTSRLSIGYVTAGSFTENFRFDNKSTLGGSMSVLCTTASTSTSSGALVVSGGVGVAGAINCGSGLVANPLFTQTRKLEAQIPHTVSTEDYLRIGSNTGSTNTYAGEFGYGLTAGGSPQIRFNRVHAGTVTTWLTVPTSTGDAEFAGSVKTAAPSGGTAANWKLGTVATVSPTSPNRTIEVDIGGTIYYIHAKTTNN